MPKELGFAVELTLSFADAVTRVREALKQEGFGVLTEIDLRAAFREKLGREFRDYVILGACNPPLAHKAITADPDIGLLLPCNVVVREQPDKKINVGFMDPIAVLKLTDNPAIAEMAKAVRGKLERVRDQLRG